MPTMFDTDIIKIPKNILPLITAICILNLDRRFLG